ncbi:hypothetical protein AAHA92_26281 [Salvia divinorum]|uniref:GDSL esterase/lipase n=1 Tax=Salvia divinorum TaxID=28513 RepID=A0ABD1GE08_SALDI
MEEKFGLKKATAAVERALFMISGGSSDMIDNYYLLPPTRAKYSLPAYHDMLLNNLDTFVRKLYKAGARNLAIIGLPPVGCLPMDTTVFPPPSQNSTNLTGDLFRRECNAKHNADAKEYNAKLQIRVKRMMVAMPTLKVVYMDLFTPMMEMIEKPNQFGFKTTLRACCGSGSKEMGPLCNFASISCHVHSEYVFWDSVNPSEAAYKALTNNFRARPLRRLFPSSV